MKINGQKIECILAESGLTGEEAAKRSGISRQSFSTIKTRGTCKPETALKNRAWTWRQCGRHCGGKLNMIQLTDKLAVIADSRCYMLGNINGKRASKRERGMQQGAKTS